MADGCFRGAAAGGLASTGAAPAHPDARCNPTAAHRLFVLNVFSIAVIVLLFGWLQAGIYHRMETREKSPQAIVELLGTAGAARFRAHRLERWCTAPFALIRL